MKARANKYGTQDERTAASKARLLDATIALIAERGVFGFSLADVGERAGDAGRGLANHHFKKRDALLEAVARQLLSDAPSERNGEWSLPGLIVWMRDQLAGAERRELALQAVFQLSACAGSPKVAELIEKYGARRAEHLARHLESARVLAQVRSAMTPDLTPSGASRPT